MSKHWYLTGEWEKTSEDMMEVGAGDILAHNTWTKQLVDEHPYHVAGATPTHIISRINSSGKTYPFARGSFTASNHGDEWWYRRVTEIPYDPSQQGDTEDDI